MSQNRQPWGANIPASECPWYQDLSNLDPNSPWGKPVPPMTDEEREIMNREYEEYRSETWCDPAEKADEWVGDEEE